MGNVLARLKEILGAVDQTAWFQIIAGLAVVGVAATAIVVAVDRRSDSATQSTSYEYSHPTITTDVMRTASGYFGDFELIDTSQVLALPDNQRVLHQPDRAFELPNGKVLLYIPYTTLDSRGNVWTHIQLLSLDTKTRQLFHLKSWRLSDLNFSLPVPEAVMVSNTKIALVGYAQASTLNSSIRVVVYDIATGETTSPTYIGEETSQGGGSLYSDAYPAPPFAAGYKNVGAMIGTYLLEDNAASKRANGEDFVVPVSYYYDLKDNTLVRLGSQIELPTEYSTAQVELNNKRSLFLGNSKLFEIDWDKKTTNFLRNVDVDEFDKLGDMFRVSDSLVWINGNNVIQRVNRNTRVYLYDTSNNQLYYRRIGETPLAQIVNRSKFLDAVEAGELLDLEDASIFEVGDGDYFAAPLPNGTTLVTATTSTNMPWSFGLFRTTDFTWLNDIANTYRNPANNYWDQDFSTSNSFASNFEILSNSQVLFFGATDWYLYTPAPQTSSDQIDIASKVNEDPKLPSSDFNTRGIWQKAPGQLELYTDSVGEDANPAGEQLGDAYALPNNKVFFFKPVIESRRVGTTRTTYFADGTLGQVYDPATGKTSVIKSAQVADQEFEFEYEGFVDNNNRIHFFNRLHDAVMVIDTVNLSAEIRSTPYGGASDGYDYFNTRDQSLTFGRTYLLKVTSVNVGDKIIFYYPTRFAFLPRISNVTGLPTIFVYDTNTSAHYNLVDEEGVKRFGADGPETSDAYAEMLTDLPSFETSSTSPALLRGGSNAIALDSETILMVLGTEVFKFNYVQFQTEHVGTTEMIDDPRFIALDDDGNLVIVGGGEIPRASGRGTDRVTLIEHFNMTSKASEVLLFDLTKLEVDANTPMMLYGNRIFFANSNTYSTIYDLTTQRYYWTAMPFYEGENHLIQLADDSILLYSKIEKPETDQYSVLPGFPDIEPGELQIFIP